VSFAVAPGDVVLFHPRMLHGGAPTHPGTRRRTLTLRFFGRDCFYDERPGRAGPRRTGSTMKQGDAFRDPSFLKLR
jgi:ectoine hydroxylase-related dioxygenase (phytanoyl-CoA dioxygenase family)